MSIKEELELLRKFYKTWRKLDIENKGSSIRQRTPLDDISKEIIKLELEEEMQMLDDLKVDLTTVQLCTLNNFLKLINYKQQAK